MNFARLYNLLRINSSHKYCCHRCSNERLADIPATFKPKDVECGWYDTWEQNDYFSVKNSDKEPISMILPPPNITGILHLGHALTVTVQDILARWYRMKGHPVIWIPGLDHAGIATQTMVERHLLKTKGISKLDMGREQFLSYVWEWKSQKEDVIKGQLRMLGASLDWSQEYFTMSKEHSNAVIEAFILLNEKNLLYRRKELINWCPKLSSAISDIEVEHVFLNKKTQIEVPGYKKKVTFGQIVKIAYPIKDSKDEIIVATTRPETLFGDVAIAVHPDDERYAKYIGQNVWHALRETHIPVIADASIDKQFGTGAVKITPAHDHTDLVIAKNHNLDIINVINEGGNITEAGKQFKDLPRFIAREKVLNELSNRDLLRGINDHKMSIPKCSRSNDIIEYLLKDQWFLKCKNMAEQAMQAVKCGDLKIVPADHEQLWYNWLNNNRDWCISRQLWWGHQIPAYNVIHENNTEWIVARSEHEAQLIASKKFGPDVKLQRDEDVLDTWFSSALLPFTTMGWPNKTQNFKSYYPLTLMETGSDILFFWVARMTMLGLELTQRLPFKEVLLHGLLCDGHGKKMSKTLGNVISPENIINGISLEDLVAQTKESHSMGILHKNELKRTLTANSKIFPKGVPECGADALRMTLCSHNIKNRTVNFEMMECQTNKFFCNKIWQASKYILLMTDGKSRNNPTNLTSVDRWILNRLSFMVDTVNNGFMERDFHKAVASIKQFLYYEFCDFYLEATKWGFKSDDSDVIESHIYTLIKCLEVSLRILAPITPYFTDDLYKRLSTKLPEFLSLPSLLEAPYPTPEEFKNWTDINLDERTARLLKVVEDVRSIIANVSKKLNPEVHIVTTDSSDYNFYKENINLIKGGSKIWNVSIFSASDYISNTDSVHYSCTSECSLFVLAKDTSILDTIQNNINKKVNPTEKQRNKLKTDTTVKSYG